jgi:DNA-binding NtrC family response regulator
VLSQGKVITSELLSLAPGRPVLELDLAEMVRTKTPLTKVLRDVERIMLTEALRQSDGDRLEAAERLGLNMATFETKLGEFSLA